MTVLIGLLIFGERPNLTGIIGIVFAFVAVFLLSIA
jgi:drug/metabolite transporter (DMT)-like permease